MTAQLAQAEREGADSGRPELEGRLALQFQLDKAPAVAPAQIILSGVDGRRTSVVPNSAYCTNVATCGGGLTPANYVAAFPNGFTASSSDLWSARRSATTDALVHAGGERLSRR